MNVRLGLKPYVDMPICAIPREVGAVMMQSTAKKQVKPVLVYWHCNTWWSLDYGADCPMDHDTPIYDNRPRRGRKRRVWMCGEGENRIAYPSRQDFLEHDEGWCG